MKNKAQIILLVVAILLLSFPLLVFAHPGRTDSNGGHTDHSTGEYHYHHGYSEHQHPNGKCPYDDNNDDDDSILIIVLSAIFSALTFVSYVVLQEDALLTKTWNNIFTWILYVSCFGVVICFMLQPASAFITIGIVGVIVGVLYVLNKWIKEKKYQKYLKEQRDRNTDTDEN